MIVSIVIMIQCSNDDNDGEAGHNIFGDIHHCHYRIKVMYHLRSTGPLD